MKKILRRYFIPHADNNYHPHILHTKRAALYGGVAFLCKAIIVGFALLIPAEAYVAPDVLSEQARAMFLLVNETRLADHLPPFTPASALTASANGRAQDMASLDYFSHQGPKGHDLAYFLERSGYQYRVAGENLALGFSDASQVVAAWQKSPTHNANLLDTDYAEFGAGLAGGVYQGRPVVYAAAHFGSPRAEASSPLASVTAKSVDFSKSRAYWREEGTRQTRLDVRATINEPVRSVVAQVGEHTIPLALVAGTTTKFAGSITVAEPAANFFKPVVLPSLYLKTLAGKSLAYDLPWGNFIITERTPVETYFSAQQTFGRWDIFRASRSVYVGLIIFFSAALALNILVQIRRQRPLVIAQTLGLIGIFMLFYIY